MTDVGADRQQTEWGQESDAPEPVDPTRSVRASLRAIAAVVAPGTAITAVLYYFGWARTLYEARQLGLEASLLGYSTSDYLLLSLSSTFWPLFLCLVAVLAGLAVHAGIVAWAGVPRRRQGADLSPQKQRTLRGIVVGLVAVAVGSALFAAATLYWPHPSPFYSMAPPVSVAVAVVCLGYAIHLFDLFLWQAREKLARDLEALRRLGASIGVFLLLVTIFWAVSHYAAIKGREQALRVAHDLPLLPDATLYSTKPLFLPPPIMENQMHAPDGSYGYSYRGLKFLFVANHKYFFRPSDPARSDLNIVVPESDALRLELEAHR